MSRPVNRWLEVDNPYWSVPSTQNVCPVYFGFQLSVVDQLKSDWSVWVNDFPSRDSVVQRLAWASENSLQCLWAGLYSKANLIPGKIQGKFPCGARRRAHGGGEGHSLSWNGLEGFVSFFLSWVLNTQLNHWTKRVVRTWLLTCDPRNCPCFVLV